MAKNRELFESENITASILKLSLPTIAGQIILVIYNMADTFFIGLTDNDAMLTSVTVCMPAFMFLSAIANLFGVGGASTVSRALGMKSTERAGAASSYAIWGTAAVTITYCALITLFNRPFLQFLGGSHPDVFGYAKQYMFVVVSAGGVFTAEATLFSHLLRAEGHSLQAGFGVMFGGILNIALDPLFMFVLLPKGMENLGAAISTMLSNIISFIYFIVVYRNMIRRGSSLRAKPDRKVLDTDIPEEVFRTGISACIMTLMENISYAVLENLMMRAGVAYQAGIGVAKKINMLAHCITRGMTQGVLPFIAYNFAAHKTARMRSAFRLSAMMSVCMASFCMMIALLFDRQLIGLFINHEGISLDYGAKFLQILCIGGPFSAFAYSVISFFQAVEESLRSFLLALLRKGALDIPLMLVLNRIISIYGIVLATPVADIICCLSALIMFRTWFRVYDT